MAFSVPKPLHLVPHNTKIQFVPFFKACLSLSSILAVVTVVLLATVGLNFGIDFRGGLALTVQSNSGPADIAKLRSQVDALGFGESQIQEFGSPDKVLVRISPEDSQGGSAPLHGEELRSKVQGKVAQAIGENYKVVDGQFIGSTVSRELLISAIWALALTCLGIFIYIWFRFEWQFALGAIVALVHDILLTVGLFSALQLDFDLSIVAALLTILGYSINDTVVIYDRIRENLRKFKKMQLADLLNLSLNETLSRTVMTVVSTMLALVALLIFGGPVIMGLAFAILFGVLIGTYSSMFIATPFLIMIGVKRDWSGNEPIGKKTKAKASV
ncbi:MAG: protein translocase subunit SecF [Alphaproteobacteria bacterium]